jgi:hypothetical protein
LARRALTDPDEGSRETWAADAPIAQERWHCSAVLDENGQTLYEPHSDLDALDSECRSVVDEVAALTATDPCADCPLAATRPEHNAWMHVVTRAYRAAEKGALRDRYPDPSAVLLDAVDALTDAVDARRDHEDEQRRLTRSNTTASPSEPSTDE